jgi:hypothetical protein
MSNLLLSNSKILLNNGKPLVNFKNLAKATSLKAWYAARLQPVVADNTAMASLSDFSNNSTVLSQATSGLRPKYRTNIINGLPAIEFDGVDDRLAFTSTSLTQNKSGLTTYVVYKRIAGTGNQGIVNFLNGSGTVRHGITLNTGAGFDQIFGAARRVTESAATASFVNQDTQFHVIANLTNYATDLLSVYFDGQLKNSAVIGGTAGSNSQNVASTGLDGIGSQGAGVYFNGYIAEFLFCEAAHSPKEVVDIMTALRHIYGGLPQ